MTFIRRDNLGGGPGRHRPLSGPETLAEIGQDLRGLYRDVVEQPLPDHLHTLLDQIHRRETEGDEAGPGEERRTRH